MAAKSKKTPAPTLEQLMAPQMTVPAPTREDNITRLNRTLDRVIDENGPQAENWKMAMPSDDVIYQFNDDLQKLYEAMSDEQLGNTKLYVVGDKKADFRVNPVEPNFLIIRDNYLLVVEQDRFTNKEGQLVLRIILNTISQVERIGGFLQELDFQSVTDETIEQMLVHMDQDAGLWVEQMLWSEFKERFGKRTDGFVFANETFGIYEDGRLYLTNTHWLHSVSLRLTADGPRPWWYSYTPGEEFHNGKRPRIRAQFRVNALGSLWKNKT